MKKLVFIIIDIILVVVFAFVVIQDRRQEYASSYDIAAAAQELSELQDKKREVRSELDKLENSTKETNYGKATLSVVCTNASAELYTDIYPSMQERGLPGTLALSLNSFPGDLNCITVAQFVELKNAGWECCLYWDGSYDDVSTWYQELQYRMTLYNFDVPTVVYCKNGTYTEELENELAQLGITGIIHHGENDSSKTEIETTDNGLWRIYSCTNGEIGSGTESVLDDKGSVVLTAGHEDELTYNLDNKDVFMSRLDSIVSSHTSEKGWVSVRLETVSDAVSYSEEKELKREKKEKKNAQQVDELKQELSDLQEQINELTQN